MGAFASLAHGAIVDSYDFGDVGVVVDVGGGDGTLLRTLLTRHPHLRGVLLDLPPVVERARERLREHGLGDRLETVAGDFFVSVPSGGDLYLLATVVHDWDDARAIEILARVRAALGPNAKVLIAEQVLPEDGRPFFGKLLDIEMLVLAGGRERTRGEYEALLDAAGLRLERVVPTRTQTSLIEARAA